MTGYGYGMVWSGMWYGCGMVWQGSGMVWYVVRYFLYGIRMVWYGIVWYIRDADRQTDRKTDKSAFTKIETQFYKPRIGRKWSRSL